MVIRNKKGDFASLLYVVILLFIIGMIFLFTNKLTHEISVKQEEIFNSSVEYQNSSAITALQTIRDTNDTAYDYGFLAIYIGCIASLGVTAFMTRIHPIFYIFYVLLGIFVLATGVLLSNAYQAVAETSTMADAAARFPIMNFMLGSYAPLVITVVIILFMVLLFGKTPDTTRGAYQ